MYIFCWWHENKPLLTYLLTIDNGDDNDNDGSNKNDYNNNMSIFTWHLMVVLEILRMIITMYDGTPFYIGNKSNN